MEPETGPGHFAWECVTFLSKMCPTLMQNAEVPKGVFCCCLAWWAFLHRRGAIFCVLEGLKNWCQNREHEEKFDPSQSKRLVLGVSERVLNPGLQEKLTPLMQNACFWEVQSLENWCTSSEYSQKVYPSHAKWLVFWASQGSETSEILPRPEMWTFLKAV